MSSRRSTVLRRLRTVPLFLLLFVVTTLVLPLLLAVALVVDIARWLIRRRPWMATRLRSSSGSTSPRRRARSSRSSSPGRCRRARGWSSTTDCRPLWAALLFRAARRLFSLRFDVEGADAVAAWADRRPDAPREHRRQPPPALFVAAPHGLRLRYVLKRELLSDRRSTSPAGGCRTASSSAAPMTRSRDRTRARTRAGLGPDEGVLIYPEGTRFTAAKRERAIERQPRAAELWNVLPPRPGGTLAVMETGADVVICAHHGLDGFASIGDLWRARAADGADPLHPLSRRLAAAGPGARTDWLWQRWHEVDDWIGEQAA